MKVYLNFVFVILNIFLFNNINSNAQSWQWAEQAGGINNDYANGLYVDNLGNSYVTGKFNDTISFNSITLISPSLWSVYIAKYDVNSNLLWAKIAASDSLISVADISVNSSGEIALTGQYFNTATFGTTSAISLTSSADYDVFVAEYDTAGEVLWAKSSGGPGIDYAGSVTTHNGNVIITGDYHLTSYPYSGSKVFISKYDNSGNLIWSKTSLNYVTGHFGNSIKSDANENIFITGEYFDTLAFDTIKSIAAGNIESNAFVAKFDSSGNMIWGQTAGAPSGYCGSKDIDIDTQGNVYMAGYYHGTITFGPLSLSGTMGMQNEVFVSKCDSSGNYIWVSRSIGPGIPRNICVDHSGIPYVSGTYNQNIIFNSDTLVPLGGTDLFIVKIDTSGVFNWAQSCGGTGNDNEGGFRVNANGIFLNGYFTDTIHFGTAFDLSVNSSVNSDLFLARMDFTSGIEKINESHSTTIYPNPATDFIKIIIQDAHELSSVKIINAQGQIVFKNTVNGNYEINTSDLSAGIYLVQIQNRKYSETKKLIIM